MMLYFFWGTKQLWIILVIMLAVALSLHMWYRFKTKAWTKSYGLWKYDKKEQELEKT